MDNIHGQTFYNTIEKPSTAEFKERGSKFIAFAYPLETVEDFKRILQQIKKAHPKATHHCFAYRIGVDDQISRMSDDGEPSGTAGRPIFGQIESKQLTNVLVIVLRYFGGTLLGVPGLINAYKTAASLALQITEVVQKQAETKYNIIFDYTQMNEVRRILKTYRCTLHSQEIQLFCNITAGIPKSRLQDVLYAFKELQHVEAEKSK